MSLKEKHRKAMQIAQEAIVAREKGDEAKAIELFKEAFKWCCCMNNPDKGYPITACAQATFGFDIGIPWAVI